MRRKCKVWGKQIKTVCPYCSIVCIYDESADKVKGQKGTVIECRKCKKEFKLG